MRPCSLKADPTFSAHNPWYQLSHSTYKKVTLCKSFVVVVVVVRPNKHLTVLLRFNQPNRSFVQQKTMDNFSYKGKMFLLMQNIFIVPAMQHGCRAKPLLEVKKTNRMANSGADINRHYSANTLLSLPRRIPQGKLSQSPKHMVIELFLFVRRNTIPLEIR